MEEVYDQILLKRLCIRCKKPLDDNDHGNRKAHPDCAKNYKKQHQKEKYQIGNTAKLMIQKNEAIAARLYKLDEQKRGISYLYASELGLKFNCPSITREYGNKKIYFFDQYGYSIDTVNGSHLLFFYHESELQ